MLISRKAALIVLHLGGQAPHHFLKDLAEGGLGAEAGLLADLTDGEMRIVLHQAESILSTQGVDVLVVTHVPATEVHTEIGAVDSQTQTERLQRNVRIEIEHLCLAERMESLLDVGIERLLLIRVAVVVVVVVSPLGVVLLRHHILIDWTLAAGAVAKGSGVEHRDGDIDNFPDRFPPQGHIDYIEHTLRGKTEEDDPRPEYVAARRVAVLRTKAAHIVSILTDKEDGQKDEGRQTKGCAYIHGNKVLQRKSLVGSKQHKRQAKTACPTEQVRPALYHRKHDMVAHEYEQQQVYRKEHLVARMIHRKAQQKRRQRYEILQRQDQHREPHGASHTQLGYLFATRAEQVGSMREHHTTQHHEVDNRDDIGKNIDCKSGTHFS